MIDNPTFDAIPDVPRPQTAQPPLDDDLEQRGWWISDETMRTLNQMGEVWFSDCCADECDGYADPSRCPYGGVYATACVIRARLKEAVEKKEGGAE